jgi:N utilization substance protein A
VGQEILDMRNEFEVAFNEIAELRSLDPEVVLEALRTALVSAYRRDSNASAAQNVEAQIDPNTGRARIFVEKEVVEDVQNEQTEVVLEKARFYDPESDLGDMVMVQVEGTTKKFGRIAAQTAKQVILQKIREAERNALYDEYVEREGDLLTGTVQSVNSGMVTLSLGRAEAIMPRAQQIPGERYRPHDKIRSYVLEVKRSNRGPQIIVSRSHRNMLRRLLEYEVPEIFNGQVEIKNIAREAGYRSKVAVAAIQEGIDPVGACVGMRGVRIQNIVKELHEEKIDVIEWNSDQEIFIAKALSPARVTGVYLDDDPDMGRTAVVIVPDDQLSLAIGREGQNARLAAKLTGWRIDIKSVAEAVQTALANLDTLPLGDIVTKQADLIEEIGMIMEKKAAGRTVMPEEYQSLNRFAAMVERRLQSVREEARQARLAELNAVRATLPQAAFDMPVSTLELPDQVVEALEPMINVGEIMLRFLIDEERIHSLLKNLPANALEQVQIALDKLVFTEAAPVEEPTEEPAVELEAVEAAAPETEPEAAVTEEAAEPAEVLLDAFGDPVVVVEEEPEPVKKQREEPELVPEIYDDDVVYDDEDDLDDDQLDKKQKGKKKKKERQQRRHLIYDEEIGETVVKRRRKGGRDRDKWDDFKF